MEASSQNRHHDSNEETQMKQWMARAGAGVVAVAACSAHAQSNVTISGNVDVGLRLDQGNRSQRTVTTNSLLPSRITFGSLEDLGGGLQAQALLETGFRIDDGSGTANPPGVATGGLSFGRFAGVALGSERTGYVSAGRQYTPLFVLAASGAADVFGGAALGGSVLVSSLTVRASNSIAYTYGYGPRNLLRGAPSTGLGFAAMYAPGEAANGSSAGNQWGFNASWGNGTWWAGYGLHEVRGNSAAINPSAAEAPSPRLRQETIAAAYSIGNLKLNTGFNRGRNGLNTAAGVNRNGWYVGLSYALTPAQEVKAFYGRVDDRRPANTDFTTWQFAYLYSLSKRTQLYALAGVVDNSATATTVLSSPSPYAITAGTTARPVALGILHRF
jgi:predicted porin